MADELIQRTIPPQRDCEEHPANWGRPSSSYHYIWKGNKDQDTYPEEACQPWYHKTAQIDGLRINSPGISGTGDITTSGTINGGVVKSGSDILSNKKDFDIPHPTKSGYRLRHVCLEGPEAGVYIRGRLTEKNTIEVPDYWDGLVDPETITVQLTQIGCSQDLIVDKIEWGKKIVIKSGNASKIDCYYYVQAERKDGEKLIPEYKGTSIEDYPGNNEEYSHNRQVDRGVSTVYNKQVNKQTPCKTNS